MKGERKLRPLTRAEYRSACTQRHPDFRRQWESLLFTAACAPPNVSATVRAPLESALQEKWPRLFGNTIPLFLPADTPDEEVLAAWHAARSPE